MYWSEEVAALLEKSEMRAVHACDTAEEALCTCWDGLPLLALPSLPPLPTIGPPGSGYLMAGMWNAKIAPPVESLRVAGVFGPHAANGSPQPPEPLAVDEPLSGAKLARH
jgi:hypothetical protein